MMRGPSWVLIFSGILMAALVVLPSTTLAESVGEEAAESVAEEEEALRVWRVSGASGGFHEEGTPPEKNDQGGKKANGEYHENKWGEYTNINGCTLKFESLAKGDWGAKHLTNSSAWFIACAKHHRYYVPSTSSKKPPLTGWKTRDGHASGSITLASVAHQLVYNQEERLHKEYMRNVPVDAVPFDKKRGRCMANGIQAQFSQLFHPSSKQWFMSRIFTPSFGMLNIGTAAVCPAPSGFDKTLTKKCCGAVQNMACKTHGSNPKMCKGGHILQKVGNSRGVKRTAAHVKKCLRIVHSCRKDAKKFCVNVDGPRKGKPVGIDGKDIPERVLGKTLKKIFQFSKKFVSVSSKREKKEDLGDTVHARLKAHVKDKVKNQVGLWRRRRRGVGFFSGIVKHAVKAVKHVAKKVGGGLKKAALKLVPKDLRPVVKHILEFKIGKALKEFMAIPKYKKIVETGIKKIIPWKFLQKVCMKMLNLDIFGAVTALYRWSLKQLHKFAILYTTEIWWRPWQYWDCVACKEMLGPIFNPDYSFGLDDNFKRQNPVPGTPFVLRYNRWVRKGHDDHGSCHKFKTEKSCKAAHCDWGYYPWEPKALQAKGKKCLTRTKCWYETTVGIDPCYPVHKTTFKYKSTVINKTVTEPICRIFVSPVHHTSKDPFYDTTKPKFRQKNSPFPIEIPEGCRGNCTPGKPFFPTHFVKTYWWNKMSWAVKDKISTRNIQCNANRGTFSYPREKSLRCNGARFKRTISTRILKRMPGHDCGAPLPMLDTAFTMLWSFWTTALTNINVVQRCQERTMIAQAACDKAKNPANKAKNARAAAADYAKKVALARKNVTLTKAMLKKLASLKNTAKKATASANKQRAKVKALNKAAQAARKARKHAKAKAAALRKLYAAENSLVAKLSKADAAAKAKAAKEGKAASAASRAAAAAKAKAAKGAKGASAAAQAAAGFKSSISSEKKKLNEIKVDAKTARKQTTAVERIFGLKGVKDFAKVKGKVLAALARAQKAMKAQGQEEYKLLKLKKAQGKAKAAAKVLKKKAADMKIKAKVTATKSARVKSALKKASSKMAKAHARASKAQAGKKKLKVALKTDEKKRVKTKQISQKLKAKAKSLKEKAKVTADKVKQIAQTTKKATKKLPASTKAAPTAKAPSSKASKEMKKEVKKEEKKEAKAAKKAPAKKGGRA